MAEYIGHPGIGPKLHAELLPRAEAELSKRVDPMPGARKLLEHLNGRVPLAVATNSPRAMLTAAMALRTRPLLRSSHIGSPRVFSDVRFAHLTAYFGTAPNT
jgi:hypothetical protein